MTRPTCASCRFFEVRPEGYADRCHRYPPTVVLQPGSEGTQYETRKGTDWTDGYRQEALTFWPEVGAEDWCGEHVPVEPTP